MYERDVWEFVPRHRGMNYKAKRTPDRLVERWKARLVAQGFKQREGLDYNKTFTSTVNMQSVRIFL